jgi:hypothetical protein
MDESIPFGSRLTGETGSVLWTVHFALWKPWCINDMKKITLISAAEYMIYGCLVVWFMFSLRIVFVMLVTI